MTFPDLPTYRSHKIVRAAPIVSWMVVSGQASIVVQEDDGVSMPYTIKTQGKIFARGEPKIGDYLVIYDEGYVSWSPRKAFEDGYTKIVGA